MYLLPTCFGLMTMAIALVVRGKGEDGVPKLLVVKVLSIIQD